MKSWIPWNFSAFFNHTESYETTVLFLTCSLKIQTWVGCLCFIGQTRCPSNFLNGWIIGNAQIYIIQSNSKLDLKFKPHKSKRKGHNLKFKPHKSTRNGHNLAFKPHKSKRKGHNLKFKPQKSKRNGQNLILKNHYWIEQKV